MSKKYTFEELEYTEAEKLVRESLQNLPHGKLKEFCNLNPNIKYTTLVAFLHNKLRFDAKKLIVECLKAFGYEDVEMKKVITFTFKKKTEVVER